VQLSLFDGLPWSTYRLTHEHNCVQGHQGVLVGLLATSSQTETKSALKIKLKIGRIPGMIFHLTIFVSWAAVL
jgi:hypothetical protein